MQSLNVIERGVGNFVVDEPTEPILFQRRGAGHLRGCKRLFRAG